MWYKAMVRNKQTKRFEVIESFYKRKTDFINDLRRNGYAVNPDKVKKLEVFNYIVYNTNCEEWDWKENN